ncbi:MAG: radical SAM protein [Candidatus Pacearchaeota archaeon]|nr:radical SAM protein [Candidatus Pacearchaeota archaeon]
MLNKIVLPITKIVNNENVRSIENLKINFLFSLIRVYVAREFFKERIKRKLRNKFGKKEDFSEQVWKDIELETLAILKSAKKSFDRGISPRVVARISAILTYLLAESSKTRKNIQEKHNYNSIPAFVTISPTNICNLKCKGCYAGENYEKHILDFNVFDWVIKEMKEKLGTRFFVISGGEPLAYKSRGKTILDIFAKHPDCFFLFFTNGTLITKKVASRLEKVANATPAISVEGLKEETEMRRGLGVFEKILEGMKNLREKGVFFGISVTPMRHNTNLLFSDDFIKFWFDEQGATYAWYFQYMPIGKEPNFNLLVTPEQRKRMWQKTWQHIKRGYFIADFWNCGTVSRGCISAAKNGGYFHILWNGDITPCVFIPFKSKDNKINNVYNLIKNKKNIIEAINTPLFKEIRKWQKRQQRCAKIKTKNNKCNNCNSCGNLLMPCPIRDHSKEFYKIIKKTKAVPFDEGAKQYVDFIKKGIMPSYNKACHQILDSVWKEHYLKVD